MAQDQEKFSIYQSSEILKWLLKQNNRDPKLPRDKDNKFTEKNVGKYKEGAGTRNKIWEFIIAKFDIFGDTENYCEIVIKV